MRDLDVGRLHVQHWNAKGSHPRRWSWTGPWPTMSGGRSLHVWTGYQAWTVIWRGAS